MSSARRIALALPLAAAFGLVATPSRTVAQAPPQVTDSVRMKIRSFTVIVRDYDEAKEWYVKKLGFHPVVDKAFGNQRFVLVAPPGQKDFGIVLEKARRDDPTMPADYTDRIGKEVNIVIATNDLNALAATLKQRGVRFRQEPRQQAWDGEAIVEDLYGNSLVFVGPLKASKSNER